MTGPTGPAVPAPGAPPVPRYGNGALSDLVPSLLAGLGMPGERDVLALDAGPRVVLLLVDGLGLSQLHRHADLAPFLSEACRTSPLARSLTVGFPSTTATSLGSIGTGLPPGQHGLLGYQVALPGRTGLLNALRWDDTVDPRGWQPEPTAFERADAQGIAVTHVGPSGFARSGLTVAALRGPRFPGANSVGELIAASAEAVSGADPSLVFAYHGDLDATGHRRGVGSPAWREELAHTDRLVERLADTLPGGTTLVVTADHGMVDVSESARIDADAVPELMDGVELLGGEPRARYVYARDGAAADVLATWQDLLGDRFWVRSRDDAVADGWFGPDVQHRVFDRIGDVVAAANGGGAVVATASEPRESRLVGMHGSLTDDELVVPLVGIRA